MRVREQIAECEGFDEFSRIVKMRAEDVVAGQLDRDNSGNL